jgi:hypothetical protein
MVIPASFPIRVRESGKNRRDEAAESRDECASKSHPGLRFQGMSNVIWLEDPTLLVSHIVSDPEIVP